MVKKTRKFVALSIILLLLITLSYTILFGISKTHHYYMCSNCREKATSDAIRIFGVHVWESSLPTTNACQDAWQRSKFANSSGFLFNSENWDGPLGCYGEYVKTKRAPLLL